MAVKGSADYIWFEDEKLGNGAFGIVYIARARKSGAKLGVKVFKPQVRPEYVKLREREVSIVRRLRHDNIVRVLDIQQEKLSKDTVLVMELCEGGSLQTVLEKPGNMYGLTETYFMLLLLHLVAGLKYLQQQRIVHRDIKPANVLIYIHEDNSHVFKLTDFGGSHELGDETEEFMSMFGTEEYLTPDMYQGALMRGQRTARGQTTGGAAQRQVFNATADLWSVGITLYQAATGRLPFRPLNGRQDRQTMLMLTTGKERGVISAVEQLSGIHYDKELPSTCQLSRGLKGLLTPLLAGLLESKKQYQFSTEEFFDRAEDIASRKVVYAFCVSTCEHIRIYIKAENTLLHVQDLLAHATDIPARDQVLYLNHAPLHHHVTPDTDVTHYPQTSEDAPLIVLPGPAHFLSETFRPCQSELPKIPSQEGSSLISDVKWAKESTAFVCYASTRVLKMSLTVAMLSIALQTVCSEILQVRKNATQIVSGGKAVFRELEGLVCAWTRMTMTLNLGHDACEAGNCLRCDEEMINKKLQGICQKEARYSREWARLLTETDGRVRHIAALPQISPQIMQRSVELSERSLHHLQADKAAGSLSHNQQQLHRFEKTQLAKQTKKTIVYFNSCTGQMIDYFSNVIRKMGKVCSQSAAVNKAAAYFETLRLESCGMIQALSLALLKFERVHQSIFIPADSGYDSTSGSHRSVDIDLRDETAEGSGFTSSASLGSSETVRAAESNPASLSLYGTGRSADGIGECASSFRAKNDQCTRPDGNNPSKNPALCGPTGGQRSTAVMHDSGHCGWGADDALQSGFSMNCNPVTQPDEHQDDGVRNEASSTQEHLAPQAEGACAASGTAAETDAAETNVAATDLDKATMFLRVPSPNPPMSPGSNSLNHSNLQSHSGCPSSQATSGYVSDMHRGDVEGLLLSCLNDTLRQHDLLQTETDLVQAAKGDTIAQLHQLVENLSDEETNRRLFDLLIESLQASQDTIRALYNERSSMKGANKDPAGAAH